MTTIPSEQIKTKEILDWKGLHLLNFRTSSCSQKLRIYLNLKKISWTSHSVNLAAGKNYTEWFLGINPKEHDIRFVEDNWESPTLGAWGVGWEVWLDGMEVTQFTYFQQCGGVDCHPIPIEITYGLERIAMFLQDKESIWDLNWNKDLKYSDIWLQFEKGQCSYNFSESNPENLRKLFEVYQDEANSLIEKKLTYPALDYVLKCSHTFNLLDARGVISVTDRAQYIEKIRKLAREVASAWIEEREFLNYPLIK